MNHCLASRSAMIARIANGYSVCHGHHRQVLSLATVSQKARSHTLRSILACPRKKVFRRRSCCTFGGEFYTSLMQHENYRALSGQGRIQGGGLGDLGPHPHIVPGRSPIAHTVIIRRRGLLAHAAIGARLRCVSTSAS